MQLRLLTDPQRWSPWFLSPPLKLQKSTQDNLKNFGLCKITLRLNIKCIFSDLLLTCSWFFPWTCKYRGLCLRGWREMLEIKNIGVDKFLYAIKRSHLTYPAFPLSDSDIKRPLVETTAPLNCRIWRFVRKIVKTWCFKRETTHRLFPFLSFFPTTYFFLCLHFSKKIPTV